MAVIEPGQLRGQIIKGYELLEMIGQGGFGAVYRARQSMVDREVAIKVVLPHYANQPEFVRRFEAEARLVARLESQAIVPLYDYWRDPDGAFLVMRLLRGGSLETALAGDAWSLLEADRLLDQITSALAVAHRNGIVHRDLKPANILLDEDRNSYLSDFGIAKNLRQTANKDDVAGLTGSPAYMSPEQIRQQPVSPQTDIYSLGIVLYEVITGHQLYTGSTTTELLMKQLNEPVHNHTISTDLPDGIYQVIERATQKDPAQRFPDARSMYAAFHQAVTGLSSPGTVATAGDGDLELIEMLDLGDFTFDTAALVNPYKGLRAFQEADSSDFFGREQLVRQLINRLAETTPLARFLAVIGPSGSGKSSVVKAGLVPALKQGALPGADHWYMLDMTPGAHPIEQLATALLSIALTPQTDLAARLRNNERGLIEALDQLLPAESQLLIVIDQFEETFTQVSDEAERVAFLDSIRAAVSDSNSRVRIIVTLRADFYDRPLLYQNFGDLVRQRTEVVLPLAPTELEQAIVGPAERIGLHIEPGLIGAIISDLREEPGALPLLQYALTEVYERREGRMLTLAAYKQSGGALGALARRAEELYEQADSAAQEAIRQLFLRLVTLGEGTEDTRRRARWTEVITLSSGASATESVLELYGRYRLLTFDRDSLTRERTIEVAHEALIREWTRLRGWLDENREELRLERRLTTASDEWQAAKRDADFLASGARLTQFEELAKSGKLMLSQGNIEYIRASVEGREAHLVLEAQQHAEEARMKRRQQALGRGLIIGGLVTALSVGLAAFALIQGQIAQQERAHAVDSASTAMAAQGLALVQADLAIKSAATATNAQGQALAQAVIAQNNAITATIAQGQALVQANTATVAQGQALVQAAIAQNNAITATIAQGQALAQAAIAQNSALTATNAQGQALVQANTATVAQGQALIQASLANQNAMTAISAQGQALDQAHQVATQAAIAKNNAITATIAQGQALIQANTATVAQGQALIQASLANQNAMTAISAQGQALTQAAIAQNNAVTATVAQGQALIQANKAATSAADALIAKQGAVDNAIRARQAALSANAEQLLLTDANTDLALALALRSVANNATASPMTESVLAETAYAQGTRRIFTNGHTGVINSVAISPNGKWAVSASDDKTLLIWDMQSGQPLTRLAGHSDSVTGVVFSPDSKTIISSSLDQTLIVWDVASGQMIKQLTEPTQNKPITCVAVLPDNKSVLAGLTDGLILQWDLQSGKVASSFRIHTESITSLAISPDGELALSSSKDQTAKVWQIKSGAVQGTFSSGQQIILAVAFHPDGKRVALGFSNGAITLKNFKTDAIEATYNGHTDSVTTLAFDAAGQWLVSGSRDNTARLWDAATGRPLAILRGHSAYVTSVTFAADGHSLMTASADKTLRLWNTVNGAELFRLNNASSGYTLAVARDHSLIAAGYQDGHIALLDAASGQIKATMRLQTDRISALDFSPDGKLLLSTSDDHTIVVWAVATGQVQHSYKITVGSIDSALFMPDNQSFLTIGAEIIFWDSSGNAKRTFAAPSDRAPLLFGGALSTDGQTLYTGSGNDIIVWQVSSGAVIRHFTGHSSTVKMLALSGNGQQLASASDDATAIIWNTDTGQMVHRLTGHTASIHSIAFSPDGHDIVTGSVDTTARLWDAQSGAEIRRFAGHTASIEGLVFGKTGIVASVALDGSFRLWQIQSTAEIISWVGANRYVRDLTCDESSRFDPQTNANCPQSPVMIPMTITPSPTPTARP